MPQTQALTEVSGWLVAGLVPITIALPYLLRERLLAANGWTMPYLQRMTPHYWIGLTIAGLGLVHAGLAMSGSLLTSDSYAAGLWVATGAMLLAFGQASIGLRLRSLRGVERLRLRKTHFRVMVALASGGLIHIALNGAVARGVLGW